MVARKAPAPAPLSSDTPLGTLIDRMDVLRESLRKSKALYETAIASSKTEYEEIEAFVIKRLLAEKAEGSKGKLASANLSRAWTYSVADRAQLEAWVAKTKNFQVFTNHLSSASIIELLTLNPRLRAAGVPGTKSFEKITIRLSSLG